MADEGVSGRLPTPFFEKGPCCSTELDGMTVPSIRERRLTMQAHSIHQAIRIRLTDLQPSRGFGLLP